MEFTGKEGGPISSENAKNWRQNYVNAEQELNPGTTVIKGHFFGKEKLQKLLDTPNSVGIRIYYASKENGEKELIIYSVRSDMTDIEPGSEEDDGVVILDDSRKCPPYCP